MNSKDIVRAVRLSDAARIAEIYSYYVTDTTTSFETVPPAADEMARRIEEISDKFPYFVYESDGRVIGYCYAHQWKQRPAYRNTAEISIYLDHSECGSGVGGKLLEVLVPACRASGLHALIACITAENEQSIRFHERHDFKRVAYYREVGTKFGRLLDVTDYELLL